MAVGDGHLSNDPDSNDNTGIGHVTVTGANSNLTAGDFARVGDYARGTLAIEGGAKATFASSLSIGASSGGVGIVTVDGAGSELDVTGLSVGGTGSGGGGVGSLTVSNHAVANINGQNFIWSHGAIHVEAGATLNISGDFTDAPTGQLFAAGPGATIDLKGASVIGGKANIDTGATLEATDAAGALNGVAVTDKGTLLATNGGTLTLLNLQIDAIHGGVIKASNSDAKVDFNDVFVKGGTLTTSSGGVIETVADHNTTLRGTAVSKGSTVTVVDNSTLTLMATIGDAGTIALNAAADVTTIMVAASGVILAGGGKVVLSDNSNNVIAGATSAAKLTNNDTISGAGHIGLGDGHLTLVNKKTIDATGDSELVINTGNDVANSKTMQATGSGGLAIADVINNTTTGIVAAASPGAIVDLVGGTINGGKVIIFAGAALEADGGASKPGAISGATVTDKGLLLATNDTTLTLQNTTVNAAGGVIKASDSGLQVNATIALDGATINSGTLTTSDGGVIETVGDGSNNILKAVTISGGSTVTAVDGSKLTLKGTIANNGTIALNAGGSQTTLMISGNVGLAGGGGVALSDSDGNRIVSDGVAAKLNNTNNTISGAGSIGNGDATLTLVNQAAGTIEATGANALVVDTGKTVTNAGILEAVGGGGLVIDDAVANTGTIQAHGGNVTLFGNLTGTGQAEAFSASRIEFKGSSNKASVIFENDFGNSGVLVLDNAASFKGTVAGLYSDGIGSDTLDLQNIDFNSGVGLTWSFSENANGQQGVLTVKDHLGDVVNIALLGQYLAAGGTAKSATSNIFQTSADDITNSGGTLITTNVHAPAVV